jgi:hypothetical protein
MLTAALSHPHLAVLKDLGVDLTVSAYLSSD